jgi:hypothetical protein
MGLRICVVSPLRTVGQSHLLERSNLRVGAQHTQPDELVVVDHAFGWAAAQLLIQDLKVQPRNALPGMMRDNPQAVFE